MTTAEIVNRITDKLRTGRVEFIRIDTDLELDFNVVEFKYGGNEYRVLSDLKQICVTRISHRAEGLGLLLVTDNYSQWIKGVLNGLVRTDAGNLVKA